YGGDQGKTVAEGGANIRLSGKASYLIDSVAITGNILSDTTTNIDIDHSTDVAISSNTFFAPKPGNLTVSNSERVVVTGNTFNPRQFERPGTIFFVDSKDCVLANSTLKDFQDEEGAVQIVNCEGMLISGLVLTGCKSGLVFQNTRDSVVANCLIRGLPDGVKGVQTDAASEVSSK
ncbi:MAG: hypothetical protein HKN23_05205, partial [Verrucomicrobiales bacterium]|nr:hypothetical protein [Verrucomicrobiales bacterium]